MFTHYERIIPYRRPFSQKMVCNNLAYDRVAFGHISSGVFSAFEQPRKYGLGYTIALSGLFHRDNKIKRLILASWINFCLFIPVLFALVVQTAGLVQLAIQRVRDFCCRRHSRYFYIYVGTIYEFIRKAVCLVVKRSRHVETLIIHHEQNANVYNIFVSK